MQCVILVAGRGTRMGKLTDSCPKPMLPIKGKPKLVYTLENLPEEIDEVILVIGYLGEQIRNFFGDEYNGLRGLFLNTDFRQNLPVLPSACQKKFTNTPYLCTFFDGALNKTEKF